MSGGGDAARAIMTTDPFPKEASVEITSAAGTFRVGGMAKGSGMIEPNMATMLGFVTTDAAVDAGAAAARAQGGRGRHVQRHHRRRRMLDQRLRLRARERRERRGSLGEADYALLVEALRQVCEPLAVGIVRGGEGATKLVTVRVTGAASNADAQARGARHRELAAGEDRDPRRRSELGPAGRRRRAGPDPISCSTRAAVRIGPVELFSAGTPHDERAPKAAEYLKGKDIVVAVDMGTGGTRHVADVDLRL